MRIVAHPPLRRRHVDEAEHLDGPVHRLAPVEALVQPNDLGDLLADRVDRVQRGHRLLEDDGDFPAANPAHLVRAERDQIAPFPQDASLDNLARRHRDQFQHGHRGDRLAAAGFADDAQRLTAPDRQIDAVDRPHHAVIGLEMRLEPANFEQRFAHGQMTRRGSSASRNPSPI